MNERIPVLRHNLTSARDQAISYFTFVDGLAPPAWKVERRYWEPHNDPWLLISSDNQGHADNLRSSIRQLMADIAQEATRSVLIDETDLRMLAQYAKRMTASLRFRLYKQWGINIHHDEGTYIGMDPSGQSEDEIILPEVGKNEFLECYRKTVELMELMVVRKDSGVSDTAFYTSKAPPVQTYQPGTAFIMMPIDSSKPELQDVRDAIKEVFKSFGTTAIRADEIEHSEGITDRIMNEIRRSEYLYADLTGERPSVYYEIGFAHAIGKTVILFRKKDTTIHFDLAYRNCPEYSNIADLRRQLTGRLTAMTGKSV